MCLAISIASDHALLTVPWDHSHPPFKVSDATNDYFYPFNPLRSYFAQPFFYAAGTQNGCGCAFRFDGFYNDEGEYESRDLPEQLALRQGLAAFLSYALEFQKVVGVLTCCSGDESFPPKYHRQARPEDFIHDRTLYRFGELVRVSNSVFSQCSD